LRGICAAASFTAQFEELVLEALVKKDRTSLVEMLQRESVDTSVAENLISLLDLNGGIETINEARDSFSGLPSLVSEAIEDLSALCDLLNERIPQVDLHVDFAELRGYQYHNGIMFAAYVPQIGRAIAWGGRYDGIQKLLGRDRGATGFSTDLKVLETFLAKENRFGVTVAAPSGSDEKLLAAIKKYRSEGYVVIQNLPGQIDESEQVTITKHLVLKSNQWILETTE